MHLRQCGAGIHLQGDTAALRLAIEIENATFHEGQQIDGCGPLGKRAGVRQQVAHPGFEPVGLGHDVARRFLHTFVVTQRNQLRATADRCEWIANAMRHRRTHLADDGKGLVFHDVSVLGFDESIGAQHQAEQGQEQRDASHAGADRDIGAQTLDGRQQRARVLVELDDPKHPTCGRVVHRHIDLDERIFQLFAIPVFVLAMFGPLVGVEIHRDVSRQCAFELGVRAEVAADQLRITGPDDASLQAIHIGAQHIGHRGDVAKRLFGLRANAGRRVVEVRMQRLFDQEQVLHEFLGEHGFLQQQTFRQEPAHQCSRGPGNRADRQQRDECKPASQIEFAACGGRWRWRSGQSVPLAGAQWRVSGNCGAFNPFVGA